ncbi:hypothetical protein B0H13DRAFT_1853074 [Mycena leptocephala]|nr:hypothetical protein B0H13DRAFT_1853074 [Mycena leptocephala]
MSNHLPQNSQHTGPLALRRRRTLIACLNCRKRKIRCLTTEQPPTNPCARCKKKKFTCEYVAAPESGWYSSASSQQTPDFNEMDLRASMSPPSPWRTLPPPSPRPRSIQEWDDMPHQPLYTDPPPPNHRPRYSGTSHSNLALSPSLNYSRTPVIPTSSYYRLNPQGPSANHAAYDLQVTHTLQYFTNPPGGSQTVPQLNAEPHQLPPTMPMPFYYDLNPQGRPTANHPAYHQEPAHASASRYLSDFAVPLGGSQNVNAAPYVLPPIPLFADTTILENGFDWPENFKLL